MSGILEARSWARGRIESLKSDAHWARTPEIRRAALEEADHLETLIEASRRAPGTYAMPPESDGHDHKPVQHRDGKPPWCNTCGLTASYEKPVSRFEENRSSVDSALLVAKSSLRWNDAGQRPDIANALRNLIDAVELDVKARAMGWVPVSETPLGDPPTGQCDSCGRVTFGKREVNTVCQMPQPDGTVCTGIFRTYLR